MNEEIKFLVDLNEKTSKVVSIRLRPNLGNQDVFMDAIKIKDYVISSRDFKKIFAIIKNQPLLITPVEGLMGYVNGYAIYDLDGSRIIVFGKENLPRNSSLRQIFSFCDLASNREILRELQKEGKLIKLEIKKFFDDYCY